MPDATTVNKAVRKWLNTRQLNDVVDIGLPIANPNSYIWYVELFDRITQEHIGIVEVAHNRIIRYILDTSKGV